MYQIQIELYSDFNINYHYNHPKQTVRICNMYTLYRRSQFKRYCIE